MMFTVKLGLSFLFFFCFLFFVFVFVFFKKLEAVKKILSIFFFILAYPFIHVFSNHLDWAVTQKKNESWC